MADTVTTIPSWIWEIDITNDPTSATTTWTDITAYVREQATIKRGRQVETGRDQAGTCALVLHNTDRRFDFFNTAGPYYPNFRPMRRIRCRATYNAVTYPLFYGYLDDPVQDYPGVSDARVPVQATDGFKVLANKLISGSFPAQRSDLRIAAILDAAGWPAALRSLAVGVSNLDAATLDRVSALEHIQQVADSESGRFFMDASGNAKFVDRHAPYLTTSQATFGESEINYAAAPMGGGLQLVYNEVIVQRAADGAAARSASDATSQGDYFTRTLSRTGMLYDSDNESSDKAAFELSLYKDYAPRITALQIDGTYQPSTAWPQALGRELGDRLTVRKRPPGGGSLIEQESFIGSIQHSVGVGTWETTFGLTAVGIGYQIYPSGKSYFVLGDATKGLIGTGALGVLTY